MRINVNKKCNVVVFDKKDNVIAKLEGFYEDKDDMLWYAREEVWSKGKDISYIKVSTDNECTSYDHMGNVVKQNS